MLIQVAFSQNGPLRLEFDGSATGFSWQHGSRRVVADVNIDKGREEWVNAELQRLGTSADTLSVRPMFTGGYFVLIIDEADATVTCYRDASGVKSGYFCHRGNSLTIGTQMHRVAKASGTTAFDGFAIRMLLATEFLYDGQTFYEGVSELRMGTTTVFNLKDGSVAQPYTDRINLATEENTLTWEENKQQLRDRIVAVHGRLAGSQNIVYLSGGIDSCVMLASLEEVAGREKVHSISYKVKGTAQDETVYAQSLSRHLGTSIDVVEVDPAAAYTYEAFCEKILAMNNPYIGMWIFPPLAANDRQLYFGGQDTRLHTPDVSKTDDLVFSCLMQLPPVALAGSGGLATPLHNLYSALNLYGHNNKYLRNFDRVLNLLHPHQYLQNHFFKFNPRKLKQAFHIELDKVTVDKINAFFHIDFTQIRNKRQLYNTIVSRKWPEQYTDDIRYMQDMATTNHTYMAMPFYDKELAEWSSAIPYAWGTRFTEGRSGYGNEMVKVNKVLLRESFRDKLNDEVYYRKKAVSVTAFLLFEGTLGRHITTALKEDLNAKDSFIRAFGLQTAVARFLSTSTWRLIDQPFLLRIYYIATLCIYHKQMGAAC